MITARNMRSSDRDAVLSIHKQSIFGLCKGCYTEKEMTAWTDRLTPGLLEEGMKDEANKGVVAVQLTDLIGYGFINVRDRELRALYVLPRYTNRGAGRLIMAKLEDIAVENSIETLSLQSTINAVSFYRKSGYQIIRPDRHPINQEVSIACVLMRKHLARQRAETASERIIRAAEADRSRG